MQRLFFLDVARFIAIFYITAYHVSRFIGFENLHSFGKIFKNSFITGGWLGCCLFFLISGYCLCINYNDKISYFEFLKKRLLKLLPAYYIAIIVWFFLIKMGITHKPTDMSAILSHVFLIHNLDVTNFYSLNGVFWFLGVLFDFYLIFPFLYKIQKHYKYGLEILTIAVFTLSLFIAEIFHINSVVFNKSILINLPCFTCGMLLYKKNITNLISNKYTKFFFLVLTFILLFFVRNKAYMYAQIRFFAILISILVGLTCISYKNELEKFPLYIKSFISQIAVASYSIYLYNYIFYVSTPIIKNSAITFIYILLVFGFGICMYKLIEEPLNNLIKKFR